MYFSEIQNASNLQQGCSWRQWNANLKRHNVLSPRLIVAL